MLVGAKVVGGSLLSDKNVDAMRVFFNFILAETVRWYRISPFDVGELNKIFSLRNRVRFFVQKSPINAIQMIFDLPTIR